MESLENMEKIEAAQTELGQFLVSMMPVPWTKICLYAKAAPGFAQTWFGFIEKETDVICARDFFFKRYDSYSMREIDVKRTLAKLVLSLYNAYLERFGEEKIWRLMFYTIESDGKVHIDFEYATDDARDEPMCNFVPSDWYPLAYDNGGNYFYWSDKTHQVFFLDNENVDEQVRISESIEAFIELLNTSIVKEE